MISSSERTVSKEYGTPEMDGRVALVTYREWDWHGQRGGGAHQNFVPALAAWFGSKVQP